MMFLSYANASLSDPGQLAIGEIVYARRLLIIYEEKASKLLNMEQMAINRTPHSLNDSPGMLQSTGSNCCSGTTQTVSRISVTC